MVWGLDGCDRGMGQRMSVNEHPRRISISLSSEQVVKLLNALREDKPFECFGVNYVIEIQREKSNWIQSDLDEIGVRKGKAHG